MSLPPVVHFEYNKVIEENTEEEKLYNYYLKPREWVTY